MHAWQTWLGWLRIGDILSPKLTHIVQCINVCFLLRVSLSKALTSTHQCRPLNLRAIFHLANDENAVKIPRHHCVSIQKFNGKYGSAMVRSQSNTDVHCIFITAYIQLILLYYNVYIVWYDVGKCVESKRCVAHHIHEALFSATYATPSEKTKIKEQKQQQYTVIIWNEQKLYLTKK